VAQTRKVIKQGVVVSDKSDKTIVVESNASTSIHYIRKPCAVIRSLWRTTRRMTPMRETWSR